MNDDFIVEHGCGISREFVGCIGKRCPRIRDGIVGFGQVGFLFNRSVLHRVKKDSNTTVSDEFTPEGNQFEGMTTVVHVGHLCPGVVGRIVSKESIRGVGSVAGRHASCDVNHAVLTRHTREANGLVAGHVGTVTPVSSRGVEHLDHARGFNGRRGKRVVIAYGVDDVVDYGAFVILLCFLELVDGRCPCFVSHVEHFHRFGVGLITGLSRINIHTTPDQVDFVRGREVGGAGTGSHLREAHTRGSGPSNGRSLQLGQSRSGRIGQVGVRETV